MKADEYKGLMGRLHEAIASMQIPEHRKRPSNNDCLRWLGRCIHERNTTHPKFEEAASLLERLGAKVTRGES